MTDLRNNTVTVYEYDYVGRFSGVNEYSTEDYYYNTTSKVSYDKQSKVTKRVLNISYNILDVADKSFNATETTSYVYDEENRLSSWTVSVFKSLTQSLTYDDLDRVSKITNVSDGGFYNEVSYGYNNSSSWKIDSYTSKVGTSSSNTTLTYEYEYDYKGNIISIETSDGKVVSYEYDEIGQLIRENNQELGKTYVYTYDDAGNILTKKVYSYTTATNLTGRAPIETKTYGYGNESWGDQLTSYNGAPITYDGIGNPLTYYNGTDYTFTWEGRRLKTAIKGNQNFTFTYNVDGIRTSKTVNGVEHTYILDGAQIAAEIWGNNIIVYLYDVNGSPIGMQYRDTMREDYPWECYWFEKNLQGDITYVYDNNGAKTIEYTYDAWGNHTTIYWNGGGNCGAKYNPFRYRGYYYDTDLGLYYLQSRYYDPVIGRFINADGQLNTDHLLGTNLFAYCYNNPVMYIDPTGHAPDWGMLLRGSLLVLMGVVTVGATIATGGSCVPLVALAYSALATAGVVATSVGVSEIYESFSGDNPLRDYVGEQYYEAMTYGSLTVISMGSAIIEIGSAISVCFVAGTQIKAQDGDVSIENIQVGDYVYAHDPETGDTKLKPVVQTFVNEATELVHVFVGGEEIVCTTEHPFYSPVKGWVSACSLRAGDILVSLNGEYVIVEQVQHEILESPVKVYNFEVQDFHTYFVGNGDGVLVHNLCAAELSIVKTNSYTKDIASNLGYTKVKGQFSHGAAIYYNPNATRGMRYISTDVDVHNGGFWKAAGSIKDLMNRATRTGTFTWDLQTRVGD